MKAILYSQSGKLGSGVLGEEALTDVAINGWRVFPIQDEVTIFGLDALTTIGWTAGVADPGGVIDQALNEGLLAAHPGYSYATFDPLLSVDNIDMVNSVKLVVPGSGTFDGCKIQETGSNFQSLPIVLSDTPSVARFFFFFGTYTNTLVTGDPPKLSWAPHYLSLTVTVSFDNGATFLPAHTNTDLFIPPVSRGNDLIINIWGVGSNRWFQGWSVLY
jgi:hypothetical protein